MARMNLMIAQAVGGWLAPFAILGNVGAIVPIPDAALPYALAFLAGLAVVIGGLIGARVSKDLPQPTLLSAIAAIAAAFAGAFLAANLFAPLAATSELMTHLSTFTPVAAAIAACAIARPRA